jgi:nitric oxide reductase NorD protein
MDIASLSLDAIRERLERDLEVEFTFYRVSALAAELAARPRDEQDFLLDWTRRIAATHVEIAWRFARRAGEMLARMDRHLIEAWAQQAMDTYDREGLRPALLVVDDIERFARLRHEHTAGALFDDFSGILLNFLHGLSGRRLQLKKGDAPWTDGETVFLPPVIADYPTAAENFRLAKILAVMMWAQIHFDGFRTDPRPLLAAQPDIPLALRVFRALELLRLGARIERELPGLHRDMQALRAGGDSSETPLAWAQFARSLRGDDAGAEDSLRLLEQAGRAGPPPRFPWEPELRLDEVYAARRARIAREKMLLRVRLRELAEDLRASESPGEIPARFEWVHNNEDTADEQSGANELVLDGRPLVPPENVRELLSSIQLDLGDVPDEYLVAAGPGEYDPALYDERVRDPDEVWRGTYHEEGAVLYPEWDFGRQGYRKNWCVMREKDVAPVQDDFVRAARERHRAAIAQLRRRFEALRDENRLCRRQPYGENVDIDALVEAIAESRNGREMSDRLFTRMHRAERDIAVVFMVDMSGSTKGWVNEVEREALVLLCEALEALGDRYAIYGFSGITRKRCELFRIKRMDEPYDDTVRARISGIAPQDYTRMGFAIRHLTRLLAGTEAHTKLLISISDGRPEDYHDGYRGRYGIEDTRQALIEARRAGVHPFCVTIDRDAREYLPHLYGPARYVVLDEARQLPLKLADVYRRLTS